MEVALEIGVGVVVAWFVNVTYISVILHRTLAHRAIRAPRWFILATTWFANTCVLYVNPLVWVARHRVHHAHSDTEDDPDKQPGDGYLRWAWRFVNNLPKASDEPIVRYSRDEIFQTFHMRILGTRTAAVVCHTTALLFACLVYRSVLVGVAVWLLVRLLIITTLSIQSYFSHSYDRGYGERRYAIDDQTSNILNPLALFLTGGECLQNNHHAAPRRASHAHTDDVLDWGFLVARLYVRLGILSIPEQPPIARAALPRVDHDTA